MAWMAFSSMFVGVEVTCHVQHHVMACVAFSSHCSVGVCVYVNMCSRKYSICTYMAQAKVQILLDKEQLQLRLQTGSRMVACMLRWHASDLPEFKQTAQHDAENSCS